jgi:hypothetical protein
MSALKVSALGNAAATGQLVKICPSTDDLLDLMHCHVWTAPCWQVEFGFDAGSGA